MDQDKILSPSTGVSDLGTEVYFTTELMKICIISRLEINCLILWSMTERNTEEELIEDYDAADSPSNNVSTTQPLYSSVFTVYIRIFHSSSSHHKMTRYLTPTLKAILVCRPRTGLQTVTPSSCKLWTFSSGMIWEVWRRIVTPPPQPPRCFRKFRQSLKISEILKR